MTVDGGPARGARWALAVMAKAPRPGRVKTRLLGELPPSDVVRLAEAMLADTLALAQGLPDVQVVVVCPAEDVAELEARVPQGVRVVGQRGSGLAGGLLSAFERLVPEFRRVVALDGDSPHLPPGVLASAFALLDAHDVVVGPTEDGGYYLVGASAIHPGLFDAPTLGTGTACDALVARARALGLDTVFTAPFYDVDVPQDLRRLEEELGRSPDRAPRTAALLASWKDA